MNLIENTSTELKGQRVKLIPLEENHIKGLFTAGQFADIWSYMPIKVETIDDMAHLVQGALEAKEKGHEFPFVIIDLENDRIVGSTRFLDISTVNKNLEIGWTWLSPDVWRTQINTEMKYMLFRYCFEVLSTLRVQLKADGRNLRSQSAIERIGATKEGVLRRNRIMYDGYVRDSVYYSILAEEWPSVKQRIEQLLVCK